MQISSDSARRPAPVAREWFGYIAAVGGSILALAVRFMFAPYFEHRTFFVIYVPAVLIAALTGGLGPAILATGLGIAISAVFLDGGMFGNAANIIDLCLFASLGPSFGIIGGRLLQQANDAK